MKSPRTSFLMTLLALSLCSAEICTFPNKVTSAQAARIAGQLPVGIAEADMVSMLKTNGLEYFTDEGSRVIYPDQKSVEALERRILQDSIETVVLQDRVETNASAEAFYHYTLQDRSWLRLHVSVESGDSTNRLLRSASILSNGVRSVSITLKKQP